MVIDFHGHCFPDEVAAKAFELGLIIIFHAGVDIGLPEPFHCNPERLLKLVKAFPGGRFVAAHMGSYLYWDDVERFLVGEDIYFDTSYSLGWISGEIRIIYIIHIKRKEEYKKMSDIQYNLQFEKLCNILQLGEIVGVPEVMLGGLLHRMYAIETTQGKYAIKALNPQIMLRPVTMQNFINSERIANIAAKNIPALPAKKFNGAFMQEIDNQFYLVFDWVDGKSLKPNEINIVHCGKIGAILADIHMTDFSRNKD